MQRAAMSRIFIDEAGSGTVMGLLWFILLVGICGLAVDITDGLRNRTMLQATADTSALAAAIDLPDQAAVKATGVAYSAANMGTDINGWVVLPNDVVAGAWDEDARAFTPASQVPLGTPLNAVYVMAQRTNTNSNPLPVNFLRIIGLDRWNVRAQAVAEKFHPPCLNDGLIARHEVHISSNNSFVNYICVHGQKGVKIQSNNYFDETVRVSMYDLDTLQLPSSGLDSNTGLDNALTEGSLDPRDVNHVDAIMASLIDPTSAKFADYVPDFITFIPDSNGNIVVNTVDEKFDLSTANPGEIYHVDCKPNKNATIPNNSHVDNVIIIAECELHIGSDATVTNSVLGSRSGGNGSTDKANVAAAAKVQLGLPDNCAPLGGVMILSNATIHTASSTKIDGVQMIAAGDIELGAADMGINGISAQSGQDITLTSNNEFGLCSGNVNPVLVTWYYRLVL